MLIAMAIFSAMSVFVKLGSKTIPPIELVFFRNIIGIVFLLPSFFWRNREPISIGSKPWILLLFRGAVGTFALYLFFYNLKHAPLALTATYVQTSPLFIALFSSVVLKERLQVKSWLGILVGFFGIVLLLNPDSSVPLRIHLLGILCGFATAMAYTSIHQLKKHFPTNWIILSFLIMGTFFPLISMSVGAGIDIQKGNIFTAPFVNPDSKGWTLILMIGFTALLGQVFLTKAYGAAKAGIVATIGYSQILFTSLLGLLLGDPIFNWMEWLGISLIVFGGVVVSLEKDN